MEIPQHWRRQQGFYALISGRVEVGEVKREGWAKTLSEKAKTRTADEVLIEFCSYVARVENWGTYSIVDHPFLGSFDGVINVTAELESLKQKVSVSE